MWIAKRAHLKFYSNLTLPIFSMSDVHRKKGSYPIAIAMKNTHLFCSTYHFSFTVTFIITTTNAFSRILNMSKSNNLENGGYQNKIKKKTWITKLYKQVVNKKLKYRIFSMKILLGKTSHPEKLKSATSKFYLKIYFWIRLYVFDNAIWITIIALFGL